MADTDAAREAARAAKRFHRAVLDHLKDPSDFSCRVAAGLRQCELEAFMEECPRL